MVVDFGYLLPNTQDPEIEVVARVNLNHKTAESFLSVLGGAMEDFKAKQAASAQQAPAPAPMPHAQAPAPAPGPAPMPPMPPTPGAPMPPAPPMPPMPQNS